MEELFRILKYKRPYGGNGEEACITMHLDVIPGMKSDDFGNRMITIGEKPNVLFSSHTDTVHHTDGMQTICKDEEKQMLFKDDDECLGADDGAGMWLMIQLINEKIPGLYIFHRGEECGGLGSSYIARDTPEILDDITIAIAFDRRGTKDIITTQSSGKCASQEFCDSLSEQLDMGHASARGSFTDTANYTKLVEECTNLSVGYYEEHRKTESLDYEYLAALAVKMMQIDYSKLVVARKKGDTGYSPIKTYDAHGMQFDVPSLDNDDIVHGLYETMDHQDIVSFVMNNPMIVADMLYDQGLTQAEVNLNVAAIQGFPDW